jgi:hypothetical protein
VSGDVTRTICEEFVGALDAVDRIDTLESRVAELEDELEAIKARIFGGPADLYGPFDFCAGCWGYIEDRRCGADKLRPHATGGCQGEYMFCRDCVSKELFREDRLVHLYESNLTPPSSDSE